MKIYNYSQKPKHNLASRIAQSMLPIHLNHFIPEGSQPTRYNYVRKVRGISYVMAILNDDDIKGAMNYLGASLLIMDKPLPNHELTVFCEPHTPILLEDRMQILIGKTLEFGHKGDTVLYTPQLFVSNNNFQMCVHRIK
jgi:hypothetical protein